MTAAGGQSAGLIFVWFSLPFSAQAAVVDGKLAYLSGLVGQDAAGVIPAAFDEQVLQIFANMQNVRPECCVFFFTERSPL